MMRVDFIGYRRANQMPDSSRGRFKIFGRSPNGLLVLRASA
jgi:hypothetical protein